MIYKQLPVIEKSERGVRSAAYKSSSQANNLMMCPGKNEHRIVLFFFYSHYNNLCIYVQIYL